MSFNNDTGGVRRWSEIDAAGIGALLALSALFYFAALRPQMERREAMAAQRHLLDAQEQKATDAAGALRTARERLETVQQQIADNPQKLEPVRALNNRLARITAAAAGRGLDLADIRPGAVINGIHYTTVPISLTGTGSFRNCVRYLHDVQEQFGDTAVTGVKLLGNPQEPTMGASFQFELRWYAAPEINSSRPYLISGK